MPEGTPLTTNKDEEPTFLSTLMADGLRRRKFSPSASNNINGPIFDKTSIPTRNVVNAAPTKGILLNRNLFRTKTRKILQDTVLTSQPVFPRAVPGDGSHVWRSQHNTSQSQPCSFPHLFITLTLSTAWESSSENTEPNDPPPSS